MPTLSSTLQRIPFIRISFLFITGILLNHWIPINDLWIEIALVLLPSLLILLWHNKHYQGIKIQNILISLALVLSGIFYSYKTPANKIPVTDNKQVYIAELCEKPSKKTNSYQSVLLVKSRILPKKEKVIVYFSKQQFDTTLQAGDQLIVHAALQEIKAKINPFDFDYKAMMNNKGIYYSLYLSPGSYQKTGVRSNKLIYIAERLRDQLTSILYQTCLKQDERAVVSALTLGYRSELDRETMQYFTDTGTIHVLSVSGLHVALVYYILTIFFRPFKRGKLALTLYPLLIISCLWCYAFITGFSPSVQRSTVMFSFVIIGSILRRPVNIYNSILASALLLILMNPNVLFDIGFQLSYLAIFGIIMLQPPLESLILIKNKGLKWLWTLFTVSIAAQIVTFPLSIFYFNQFPNLFWLSNFIAIPGTTIIIWLTFLFFLFSPIGFIANFLAVIIQFVTHIVLLTLQWISQLPHAISEGIVFNSYQTLIMYGLIIALIFYVFSKNKKWLFSSLVLLILFQTSTIISNLELFNQKMIFQYHAKSSIIHCINGRNNYILRVDDKPLNYQDMQLIKNTCYNLKLHKPEVIRINTLKYLAYKDLVVKDGKLLFINCQLILEYPNTLHIQARNLLKSKENNREMINRPNIYYSLLQPDLSIQKSTFSCDLRIQNNEAVCIFIK